MTASQATPKGSVFYVSCEGDDGWSGELPAPNRQRTDGPFATLERARDEIRRRRAAGLLPPGPVTVFLRGGIYRIEDTFVLGEQDSGTEQSPVTYRA